MFYIKFRQIKGSEIHYWGWINGEFVQPYRSGGWEEAVSDAWIGKFDVNGLEIYQRDVSKRGEDLGLIAWSSGRCGYVWLWNNRELPIFEEEIIGNIHQNRDLIK